MAKVLGITGGIGSGKSYVCGVFRSLGCKVYDSDSRTKELYDENPEILDGLTQILGKGILKNGKLDRKAMAELVFNDSEIRRRYNSLVHAEIIAQIDALEVEIQKEMKELKVLLGIAE